MISPKCEKTVISPKCEKTVISPKCEKTVISPKCEKTVISPKCEKTVISPKCEKIRISPKCMNFTLVPYVDKVNTRTLCGLCIVLISLLDLVIVRKSVESIIAKCRDFLKVNDGCKCWTISNGNGKKLTN